jgi:NMD protein affecting ribosome stability and mRNA decay
MKCPRCGRENRVDAAFCDECGARLEASCPACSEPNRLGAKFCRKCGESLGSAHRPTPIVPAQALRAPETYTPKHLAEKILTVEECPRRRA